MKKNRTREERALRYAAVLLRLRRSQRYSALRLLPATVRLHTFTATAAATQRTRQTTRVCRTATLQCV